MKPDKTTVKLVRFNEKVFVAIFLEDSIEFKESTIDLKDQPKAFGTLFDSFEMENATDFDSFLDSDEVFDFFAKKFKIDTSSSEQVKIILIKFYLEKLKINKNEETLQKLQAKLELATSQMSDGKKDRFEKFNNKFYNNSIYLGLEEASAKFGKNKPDPAVVFEKPDPAVVFENPYPTFSNTRSELKESR